MKESTFLVLMRDLEMTKIGMVVVGYRVNKISNLMTQELDLLSLQLVPTTKMKISTNRDKLKRKLTHSPTISTKIVKW